ncbi:MAG: hypothetical protein KJ804_00405 [Proteobacteria bacterium]|nr:hypothetical protein [Pseudomonadota bacterium]MBU1056767.1 hypothetical protein [Pseudomonadota bacterium]
MDEGRSAQAGIVLGALLTVASLMLAFTFSMAGGQFNARRELVIEDINAIGTAFLRAEQMPEPQRSTSASDPRNPSAIFRPNIFH